MRGAYRKDRSERVVRIDELRAELELACVDALGGDPAGPRLYARLRRVVESRLRRLSGVDHSIAVGPGATVDEVLVEVELRTPRRVERIRLDVSPY